MLGYGFDGEAVAVHGRRYRDCTCGADGEVISGTKRHGVTDRRLRCGCGRQWRQIIHPGE